jgi:hypothetical protein
VLLTWKLTDPPRVYVNVSEMNGAGLNISNRLKPADSADSVSPTNPPSADS